MNDTFKGTNRLMLITHRTDRYTELQEAELFLEGGGSWVQLRMKDNLNIDTARQIAALCNERNNSILCIDDNVEIALESGARAVHLGKHDMPIAKAWELVKATRKETDFIVGATANTFEDIRNAAMQGASYIGLGPFRFTQTKKKLSPILGIDGYRRIIDQCNEADIHLPIYAIGGIELSDIPQLMQTGITGIAVSGSIVRVPDPIKETQKIIETILASV